MVQYTGKLTGKLMFYDRKINKAKEIASKETLLALKFNK
jgi:hypothetical protein